MEYKITIHDESETIELAENFESEKFPNMVICLNGDLGSGKTVFAKGFANALGIDEQVTSPTFNIVKEYYSGELPFFHMDVYRIDEGGFDINFSEYFVKKGVSIIEWASLIKEELPDERLEINIKIIDEEKRSVFRRRNPLCGMCTVSCDESDAVCTGKGKRTKRKSGKTGCDQGGWRSLRKICFG